MQLWHSRLLEGIGGINASNGILKPDTLALSGDLYNFGRHLNVYLTSLITALRVTGDLTLLDEADRIMEVARTKLADYNGDGFLNWRYLNPREEGDYFGDDYHVMDEVLTHSMVASVAAALKANEAFNPRYAEHAAFWTDYLQNQFEAKWRRRNEVSSGFPFMSRDLTHPYIQFIRYHHYMYSLTGDAAYAEEAQRRAQNVTLQVREVFTPAGPAYVWDQRFFPDKNGSPIGCQPFVYLQYTFQGFQDLAFEGVSPFSTQFMQRAATAMTALVMDDGYASFAPNICGGVFQKGLYSTTSRRGREDQFLNYPFGVIGKWDASGKIEATVRAAYDGSEINPVTPTEINLSAIMLLLLANDPDAR